MPGSCWPASLVELVSPQSVRDSITRLSAVWNDTHGCPLASTRIPICHKDLHTAFITPGSNWLSFLNGHICFFMPGLLICGRHQHTISSSNSFLGHLNRTVLRDCLPTAQGPSQRTDPVTHNKLSITGDRGFTVLGSGGPNSCPHTCVRNALPTEPSPQPWSMVLFY